MKTKFKSTIFLVKLIAWAQPWNIWKKWGPRFSWNNLIEKLNPPFKNSSHWNNWSCGKMTDRRTFRLLQLACICRATTKATNLSPVTAKINKKPMKTYADVFSVIRFRQWSVLFYSNMFPLPQSVALKT